MKIAVLSSFTTSLFWFRVDMMQSFQRAGYEVLAVGDGDEAEWAERFTGLGIRYRHILRQLLMCCGGYHLLQSVL